MLLVVRHADAEVRCIGGPPEDRRPLTPHGRRQADELIATLVSYEPIEIHTSPYERAAATVAPTAAHLGIPVRERWELQEWDDGLETTNDWEPLYDRCWSDPEHRHGLGESHAQLIARAAGALDELLTRADDRCIIAASHGTWIARGFQGFGISDPLDLWRQMPAPAIYRVDRNGDGVTVTGPGLA